LAVLKNPAYHVRASTSAMRVQDEETDFEIKSRNRRRKKMRGPWQIP
jgi:hypothetical protein